MKTSRYVLASLLIAGLTFAAAVPQKGGEDETGPYEVVPNWPQPFHEEGWTWGSTAAVWAESPDRLFVFQRGELDVLKAKPGGGGLPPRAATNGQTTLAELSDGL
jgi:hypothetical protein